MADQTSTPAVSPCGAPSGGGGGAEGAAPQQGGLGSMLLPIVIFILIFYFMILRPQNKRKKQQDELLNSITRGDSIVTISGVFGTVREVRDDSFMIEIAEGVRIRVLKSAIQTKRAPGGPVATEDKKD